MHSYFFSCSFFEETGEKVRIDPLMKRPLPVFLVNNKINNILKIIKFNTFFIFNNCWATINPFFKVCFFFLNSLYTVLIANISAKRLLVYIVFKPLFMINSIKK